MNIRYVVLGALVVMSSCGDGGSSDETETQATATTNPGETSAGSESDTGAQSHEICDRYIACVAATTPDELPAVEAGYGKDSPCWMGTQDEIDICLLACDVGLEQGAKTFPDEPLCDECTSDADCEADGEQCYEGVCGGFCGDGIVQDGELCDGGQGCGLDCESGATCSPLTGFPCSENCTFMSLNPNEMSVRPFCNGADSVTCGEEVCEVGEYCDHEADACRPLCDLYAPEPCPEGLVCIPYLNATGYTIEDPALLYIGQCMPEP